MSGWFVAGGSGGFAVRSAGVPDRGGAERVADAETPDQSAVQTAGHHVHAVRDRAAAVGGQLRAPLRLRVRLPAVLRAAAVRIVWPVRQAQEGRADLGVLAVGRVSLHLPGAAVLHHSGLRLQDLLVLQLRAPHRRLLRLAEHQLQTGGACGMTNGVTVTHRTLLDSHHSARSRCEDDLSLSLSLRCLRFQQEKDPRTRTVVVVVTAMKQTFGTRRHV